jgi:hypothetical protein
MSTVKGILTDPLLLLSFALWVGVTAVNPEPTARELYSYTGLYLTGILARTLKEFYRIGWIWRGWKYLLIGVLGAISLQSFLEGQGLRFASFAWISGSVFNNVLSNSTASIRLRRFHNVSRSS